MLPTWEMITRLLIAAALGSVIGVERERLAWAAGLRTHMLVSVGACLVMIVSAFGFQDVLGQPNVTLDPSRMAAQVVSGIGFLGAGSIVLRGEVIRGLTTAASLWAVAAIGLAVGSGLYIEAAAATVIILIILAGVKPIEERFMIHRHIYEIKMIVTKGLLSPQIVNDAIGVRSRQVTRYICTASEDPALDEVTLTVRRMTASNIGAVVQSLEALPQVKSIAKPPKQV